MTIDFDIYQKIKQQHEQTKASSKKKEQLTLAPPSLASQKGATGGDRRPNGSIPPKEEAEVYRKRLESYATRLRKFSDGKKFIFSLKPKDLTSE